MGYIGPKPPACKRQKSPGLVGVRRPPRQLAKNWRFKIVPQDYRCAHLHVPESNRRVEMNHINIRAKLEIVARSRRWSFTQSDGNVPKKDVFPLPPSSHEG